MPERRQSIVGPSFAPDGLTACSRFLIGSCTGFCLGTISPRVHPKNDSERYRQQECVVFEQDPFSVFAQKLGEEENEDVDRQQRHQDSR